MPTVSQKREGSPGFCLAGNRAGRAQLLEEFFAQTVEAAVRHNQQQVARLGFARKMLRNGIRTRKDVRVSSQFANIGRYCFWIHAVFVAQLLSAVNAAAPRPV